MLSAVLGISILAAIAWVVLFLMLREPLRRAAADAHVSRDAASQLDSSQARAGIRSRGVVTPKIRVQIMPEVAGKIVYAHSQLHAGGLIRANERIAQIDPSGYDLAVQRARAVLDEAQAKLDLGLVAAGMRQEPGRPFDAEGQAALPAVLHEPLVRQAAAALESAKAELALAELQLSRTSVVLPYDVLIVGEPVSLGQYVQAGRSLADACGTETFEVEASIRSEDLCRLGRLEGVGLAGQASRGSRTPAEIKAVFAGREHAWAGEVVRTTGQASPESGMISVVVEVPQPLEASADRPPLLPGMAVDVLIGGRPAGARVDVGDTGEP